MRTFPLLLSACAGLSMIGCGSDSAISKSIAASVNAGPGGRVVLVDVATFQWDKACIFGPYTPDRVVDAATGIPGAASRAYDIRSSDVIHVLLFVHKGRITKSVAHRRALGDFGPEIVGACYSREEAVFSVRNAPSGSWGNIGPL